MDIFTRIEKERKRMEREKNKKMKEFVTRKINFILNVQYLLEEYYNKEIGEMFLKNNSYNINVGKMVKSIKEVIEVQSSIVTNGEISESQRTFSNNNYESNLLLTLEEKNELIEWLNEFEYKFNHLEEIERKLIYYTFVEKENNVWLSLNTNYSERTIATLKNKAINELYRQLKLGKITFKETFAHNRINF